MRSKYFWIAVGITAALIIIGGCTTAIYLAANTHYKYKKQCMEQDGIYIEANSVNYCVKRDAVLFTR